MGLFGVPLYHSLFMVACLSLLVADLTRVTAAAAGGNETDGLALLELKAKITGGLIRINELWNATTHFCEWYGVTCGRRHQRVTKLELRSLHLVGSLSPYIGNLSFLKLLDLQGNSLSGEIPQEVGRLRRLKSLQLANNSFVSTIPVNISGCSRLAYINVSRNLLTGGIPSVLGDLTELKEVLFYLNGLQGGIPSSLGNLSSLEYLSLGGNNFTGDIPEGIGHLKNLTFFSVVANNFTGLVPPSIFNLSHLSTLDLGENQFQGSLPSNLGISLPKLEVLGISKNRFTGKIPPSISNSSSLILLEVVLNKLSGNMPDLWNLNKLQGLYIAANQFGNGEANDLSFLCTLTNATGLEALYINQNNFGGEVPECVGNLSTNLAFFALGQNKLSGIISPGFQNLVNLETFQLTTNQFSGEIPYGIGRLQKLTRLYFDDNNLSGSIPPSLGNLSVLSELALSANNLQGGIPASLANCTSLTELDLSGNNLSGSIPPQIFRITSLSIGLFLSGNHLMGALPEEVKSLTNIEILLVADNFLSGNIPINLGSCIHLEMLDLSGNLFKGNIPASLSSLRGIEVLDLSQNNLTGQIPRFLQEFDILKVLNLSNNDFEGAVPLLGVFTNTTATSVNGNRKLCGGIPEFNLPRCNPKVSNMKKSTTLKLILSIIFSIFGVALVSCIILLCWLKYKRKVSESTSQDENIFIGLSYQSLHEATDGFSPANLIGVGSFGSVYKGLLDQGRRIVAVKVLDLLRSGASKSFLTECEALRNIRHRNLLKILTVCSSVDNQGNDFKALVYEFMSNGSLEEWLHPDVEPNELNVISRNLSLLQRLSIAIDVACALDYLHYDCEIPIVHCDIKPSNVLLDDDMTAHVGDFGLVRILSESPQNSSENDSSSIAVKGTVGYAAPEYGMGSEVSTHGDVYSYGILLLEIFTGKRPTESIFVDGLNLHNFVNGALPDQVVEIVDPSLLSEYQEQANVRRSNKKFQQVQECLTTVLGIGLACSSELPQQRMGITDVVAQLNLARDKLVGAGKYGRMHIFNPQIPSVLVASAEA